MQNTKFNKIDPKNFICILFGSIILAVGINLFIAPHNLAFGGVTGIAIILQDLAGIPVFASNLFISIALILLGWFEIGKEFMIKTVIPTIAVPVFLFFSSPISKLSLFLPVSAVMGAITIGIAISLTMFAGGSTAGPDTLGLILKKRFGIPTILTMAVIDISVILCGYHVYGTKTATWSVGVALLMNIIVKFGRDTLSKKLFFRYWSKQTENKTAILRG